MQKPSLDTVLKYSNDQVVFRMLKLLDISKTESEEIFVETKKWLWLCAKHEYDIINKNPETPKGIPITRSTLIIDEMWHNFILFTNDYANFCQKHFGFFIHHFPGVIFENEEEGSQSEQMSLSDFRIFVEYVYNNLGKETTEKWFKIFDDKYTPDVLSRLKKGFS